jgi:hypothetical protein
MAEDCIVFYFIFNAPSKAPDTLETSWHITPCPAQCDALYLIKGWVSQRCCLPCRTNNGNAGGELSCGQNAHWIRSHPRVPQMKADFNEHCVSKPASSGSLRAAEGTSHLCLLTERNAVAGRSYRAFLCLSNRVPAVSWKNCSLFHGDDGSFG